MCDSGRLFSAGGAGSAPLSPGARAGRLASLILCVVCSMSAMSCRKHPAQPTVTIAGHAWRVELALTGAQRERGLSGRYFLDDSAGMLFIFGRPEVRTFHMLGCYVPLDIAFIGPDMRVVGVDTMEVEADRTAPLYKYSSRMPIQYVLEVNAGQLARYGVTVGEIVTFSPDIPHPTKAE